MRAILGHCKRLGYFADWRKISVAVDRKSSYVGGVTRRKFEMFNSAAEIKTYALAGHATVNPPYI